MTPNNQRCENLRSYKEKEKAKKRLGKVEKRKDEGRK
jgi:hypothetical protein